MPQAQSHPTPTRLPRVPRPRAGRADALSLPAPVGVGDTDRSRASAPVALGAIVPSLAGIVPLVFPSEIDRYRRQMAEAKGDDVASVMQGLLHRAGVQVDPAQMPEDALLAWLSAQYLLPSHMVALSNQKGQLQFAFEPYTEGYYKLDRLHRILRPLDPWLLPALVRAFELLSGTVLPVCGPWRMEEYAEYLWSVDQFLDFHLEDRVTAEQQAFIHTLNSTQALRIMRKLALPHEMRIRDTLPYPYFSVKDEPHDAVKRLGRALKAHPQVREVAALAPLMDLLPKLIRLRQGIPEMTDQEVQEVTFLPPLHTVFSPSPKPGCAVWEAADEFMRMHWEGGERSPGFVLQVDRTRRSQDRLLRFLPVLVKFVGVMEEALTCLGEAQPLE